jgi:hypothetical protein
MATKLVSMKLPPRDKTSEEKIYTSMADGDGPKYPWGLCLTLDEQQLKQLGITDLPKVDGTVTITAKADVTSVSENQTQDGPRRSVSLQITDLGLGGATDAGESGESE